MPDPSTPSAPMPVVGADRARRSVRRAAWGAALLVFLTAGYFQNSRPGWNVNSLYSLTCALVERHTLQIDAYHDRPATATGDKVFFGGHYYCDKSALTALLGVPAFATARWVARVAHTPFSYEAARYWTTWGSVGVAAAVLAALLTVMLARRGVAPGRAGRAAALWIAATPLLGYAILYYNYLPACALAMAGFLITEPVWRGDAAQEEMETDDSGCVPWNKAVWRRQFWRLLIGGMCLGLATWGLNLFAVVALGLTWLIARGPSHLHPPPMLEIIAGGGLTYYRASHGVVPVLARLVPWVLGGVIGAAGHFLYGFAIFGRFGVEAYHYEADPFMREQMRQGFMGATQPRWLVAWLETFHPFQGLFIWFPLTALALAGLIWLLTRPMVKRLYLLREAWVALLVFALLLLYISAYYMWWGGWAYGPRHLIPALPLMAMGLVPWLRSEAGRARWPMVLVWIVGVIGAVVNTAAVALDPQVPPGLPVEALMNPHQVPHWPAPFLELQRYFWLHGQVDHNLGTAFGLRGPWSLLPLAAVWVMGWWVIGRVGKFKQEP